MSGSKIFFKTQPESSDEDEKEQEQIHQPKERNLKPIIKRSKSQSLHPNNYRPTTETPIQYYPIPVSIPITVPIPVPYPVYSPQPPPPTQLVPINLNSSHSLPSFSNNYGLINNNNVKQPKKHIYNIINQSSPQNKTNTTSKKLINTANIVSIKKI